MVPREKLQRQSATELTGEIRKQQCYDQTAQTASSKGFYCNKCGVWSVDFYTLHEHIFRDEGHLFKCSVCSINVGYTIGDLISHVKSFCGWQSFNRKEDGFKSTAYNYFCDKCGGGFRTLSSLKSHYVSHKVEVINCVCCDFKPRSVQSLLFHVKQHFLENNLELICHICSLHFHALFPYQHHYFRVHSQLNDISFKCLVCSTIIIDDEEKFIWHLQTHNEIIRKGHLSKKNFDIPVGDLTKITCEICAKIFPTENECNKHRTNLHALLVGDHIRRKCPVCSDCILPKDVSAHLRKHKQDIRPTKSQQTEGNISLTSTIQVDKKVEKTVGTETKVETSASHGSANKPKIVIVSQIKLTGSKQSNLQTEQFGKNREIKTVSSMHVDELLGETKVTEAGTKTSAVRLNEPKLSNCGNSTGSNEQQGDNTETSASAEIISKDLLLAKHILNKKHVGDDHKDGKPKAVSVGAPSIHLSTQLAAYISSSGGISKSDVTTEVPEIKGEENETPKTVPKTSSSKIEPLQCKKCDMSFNLLSELVMHMTKHSAEDNKSRAKSRDTFETKLKPSFSSRSAISSKLSSTSPNPSSVSKSTSSKVESLKCNECDASFTLLSELVMHMAKHSAGGDQPTAAVNESANKSACLLKASSAAVSERLTGGKSKPQLYGDSPERHLNISWGKESFKIAERGKHRYGKNLPDDLSPTTSSKKEQNIFRLSPISKKGSKQNITEQKQLPLERISSPETEENYMDSSAPPSPPPPPPILDDDKKLSVRKSSVILNSVDRASSSESEDNSLTGLSCKYSAEDEKLREERLRLKLPSPVAYIDLLSSPEIEESYLNASPQSKAHATLSLSHKTSNGSQFGCNFQTIPSTGTFLFPCVQHPEVLGKQLDNSSLDNKEIKHSKPLSPSNLDKYRCPSPDTLNLKQDAASRETNLLNSGWSSPSSTKSEICRSLSPFTREMPCNPISEKIDTMGNEVSNLPPSHVHTSWSSDDDSENRNLETRYKSGSKEGKLHSRSERKSPNISGDAAEHLGDSELFPVLRSSQEQNERELPLQILAASSKELLSTNSSMLPTEDSNLFPLAREKSQSIPQSDSKTSSIKLNLKESALSRSKRSRSSSSSSSSSASSSSSSTSSSDSEDGAAVRNLKKKEVKNSDIYDQLPEYRLAKAGRKYPYRELLRERVIKKDRTQESEETPTLYSLKEQKYELPKIDHKSPSLPTFDESSSLSRSNENQFDIPRLHHKPAKGPDSSPTPSQFDDFPPLYGIEKVKLKSSSSRKKKRHRSPSMRNESSRIGFESPLHFGVEDQSSSEDGKPGKNRRRSSKHRRRSSSRSVDSLIINRTSSPSGFDDIPLLYDLKEQESMPGNVRQKSSKGHR